MSILNIKAFVKRCARQAKTHLFVGIVQAGTILAGILGVGKYEVNSYHHQAVCRLSPYVTPSAVSEDGLVEAIEIKEKRFALGVQWHPEFIQDDGAMKLVRAMIHAC